MGAKDAKRLARAFDRVEARHQITDPGDDLPFDDLLREALLEVRVELDVRDERARRKIRKAARRLNASAETRARMPGIAAAVDPRPTGFGPPGWHPEARHHSDN